MAENKYKDSSWENSGGEPCHRSLGERRRPKEVSEVTLPGELQVLNAKEYVGENHK